ncbi:MAG: amidohydrolase family protein [Peptococcaceae bacterium]
MKKTVFYGGLVINGIDSTPLEKGAILIEGNKIIKVGRKEELAGLIDSSTEEKDYSRFTIIPGLVDCHNHLSLDGNMDNYLTKMEAPECELTIRACSTMQVDFKAGVTTSRCLGDRFFLDVACKRAVEEGRLTGPRLVVSTRGIRATHGHGVVGLPFNGPEAIRQAVRENLKAGADFIKFYMTGTVRENSKTLPYYMSPEEVKVITEEAGKVGVKTAVHCIGGKGFEICIEQGVDVIEHGFYLTDHEIELLLNSDSWLVLTPSLILNDDNNLPPEKKGSFKDAQAEVRERLQAIIKSGVKYAAGTDAMHGKLVKELEYIVEAGATELEALRSVTLNAARVCGLADLVGSLEVGKMADMVIINGNPLADIKSLWNVESVIKEGKEFKIK